MQNKELILIVDDDPGIRSIIVESLTNENFQVLEAVDGDAMNRILSQNSVDLILLDLSLSNENGLDLARNLRVESNIPIIILSGKNDVIDKVVGLEIGADDYITKPFHNRELLARINAVLRRKEKQKITPNNRRVAKFGIWELNFDLIKLISNDNVEVTLTTFEFKILSIFIDHPKQTLSRDQILNYADNKDWNPFDRSIDVIIGKIRKKLNDDPKNPTYIRTVWNSGYVFLADVTFN